MARNITFTADEAQIEEAREAARADHTTLNGLFNIWLEQYGRKQRAARAMQTVERLRGYARTDGHKFSRDAMMER